MTLPPGTTRLRDFYGVRTKRRKSPKGLKGSNTFKMYNVTSDIGELVDERVISTNSMKMSRGPTILEYFSI